MTFKKDTLFFIFAVLVISALIYLFSLNLSPWFLMVPLSFYLYGLISGSIFIQLNYYITSINKLADFERRSGIKKDKSAICLSFDDGIHATYTPLILDILKQQNVQAIFFIIGKNITGNEAILKRILDEGHTIGNHSQTHSFWFSLKSSKAIIDEIQTMNDNVVKVLGSKERPVYFRPPYGVTNPNVAKAINLSGMVSVGWLLRSMDTKADSKVKLLNKLKKKTKKGDIVLLHDRCKITVDILTDYILFCKGQGFTFATI